MNNFHSLNRSIPALLLYFFGFDVNDIIRSLVKENAHLLGDEKNTMNDIGFSLTNDFGALFEKSWRASEISDKSFVWLGCFYDMNGHILKFACLNASGFVSTAFAGKLISRLTGGRVWMGVCVRMQIEHFHKQEIFPPTRASVYVGDVALNFVSREINRARVVIGDSANIQTTLLAAYFLETEENVYTSY